MGTHSHLTQKDVKRALCSESSHFPQGRSWRCSLLSSAQKVGAETVMAVPPNPQTLPRERRQFLCSASWSSRAGRVHGSTAEMWAVTHLKNNVFSAHGNHQLLSC